MKKIRLTGKHATGAFEFALVDDEDFDLVSPFRWKATPPLSGGKRYAVRNVRVDGRHVTVSMHRFLMNEPIGMDVAHVNHNTVDNQKANLRICDRSWSVANRTPVQLSGTCKTCGKAFHFEAVPSGTEAHWRYCSDACRPVKRRDREHAATAAWKRAQGIE
jgi:hypothetical protein